MKTKSHSAHQTSHHRRIAAITVTATHWYFDVNRFRVCQLDMSFQTNKRTNKKTTRKTWQFADMCVCASVSNVDCNGQTRLFHHNTQSLRVRSDFRLWIWKNTKTKWKLKLKAKQTTVVTGVRSVCSCRSAGLGLGDKKWKLILCTHNVIL